jgi:hypothetical protein
VLSGQVLDGFLQFGVHARSASFRVVLVQSRFDVGFGSHLQTDFHPQQMRQAVDGIEIGRIGHGDSQSAVVFENRDDTILLGDMARNRGDDVVGNLDISEFNDFSAEVGSFGLGDVGWPNDLIGHHEVDNTDAGSLGFIFQRSHLFGTHEPEVDQDIYQIIVFFSHSSK